MILERFINSPFPIYSRTNSIRNIEKVATPKYEKLLQNILAFKVVFNKLKKSATDQIKIELRNKIRNFLPTAFFLL